MRITRAWKVFAPAALAALLLEAGAAPPTPAGDALRRGFADPPAGARPRVWWHWMNGNITKEGIKLDLEWMKRIGLGGFQNFDAALNTPQIVEKRLVYMTPEWKDAFKYAATLADQMGLEMAIAGSPGWSESGGPWVPPSQAMKKLVWSETRVEGGKPFAGTLPKPPSTTGPFQNIAGAGRGGTPLPEFYADAAVVAYPAPADDVPLAELQPKVSSSGGSFDLASLTDGDLVKSSPLPAAPAGEKAWIQFEFPKPQTIQGVTLVTGGGRGGFGGASGEALEASPDGQAYRVVTEIAGGGAAERTTSFPPVTARFFRVTFASAAPPAGRGLAAGAPQNAAAARPPIQIAELALHPSSYVNRFEDKAAFAATIDLYSMSTPAQQDAVPKAGVIDLTSRMRPDGSLDWTPPPGRWVALRLGYSLTGHQNSPASPEATGLEVDKLNRTYVKDYFTTYLDMYKNTVGPSLMGAHGLQYVITDSWEAGVQNWTDDMIAEFSRRRGYDMRPWLPVLTGRVVESPEASDRFLWDFRRTIADLTAENHYDQLTDILKERGMARYSESHEAGRAFIADGMEVKREAAIPMSAMWTQSPGVNNEQYGYNADIRESASVAHIYGQNIVAAESLTARTGAWSWSPETLKPTADKELAMGLNRFVIHTSVHQPTDDKIPGLGLGPYGQWFTRHETWAELAKPWITYLARSSFLLQQGKFAADVAYFYGEDDNLTALFRNSSPDVPEGYAFDYINADALRRLLDFKNGRLTTPSGMSYRVLALDPNSRHMSLPVLRKIRDLVNAGAALVGPKPVDDPSLSDDQAEFQSIANQLFGTSPGARTAGKGMVYAGQSLAEALPEIGVQPDFEYPNPHADTHLLFVHRKLADGDLYWVDNRGDRAENVEAAFRVQGKAAELWHADTGKVEAASYRTAAGRTTVPLKLGPWDAVFVVFRGPAAAPARTLHEPAESEVTEVTGPWEVSFQADRGAPARMEMDKLASFSESAEEGVKYFSGTATYRKTLQAPATWFRPGAQLWLDLGDVKNLAKISINAKDLGIVWRPPFRVDAAAALKPGANVLLLQITDLWVNRLIGDQQPNAAKKYTWTAQQFYQADSPLVPSGLLGPVRLVRLR
ncbi:MAG TPA: glycosyl hydrolase [Bryobacteraceae bacterium]|nr:glycosyl hydrolase [Bryobacteraceae bacterium]